jgi:hypothetical protein
MKKTLMVFAALLIVAATAMAQYTVFPQFAIGGGYTATIYVTNSNTSAETFGLSAYTEDGQPWPYAFSVKGPIGSNGLGGTIPPQATWKFEITGDPNNTNVGYIVTTTSNWYADTLVTFNLLYQFWNGNMLISTVGVPAVFGSSTAYFSPDGPSGGTKTWDTPVDVSGTTNTGIALTVYPTNSLVYYSLYDSNGTLRDTLTSMSTGQSSMFIDQLFPNIRQDLPTGYGHLNIMCFGALNILILRSDMSQNGMLFTSLPKR